MKKILTIIITMLLLQSCWYDNTAYKYGNAIKDTIKGGSMALACVAVSPPICVSVFAIEGYIDGKQEARDKITASENAELVKAIADKKAKEIGVEIDNCWLWCD